MLETVVLSVAVARVELTETSRMVPVGGFDFVGDVDVAVFEI